MTNGVNCRTIEGVEKHKQHELKNTTSLSNTNFDEIIAYNSKQIQILSRTLEIRLQRSLMLPT